MYVALNKCDARQTLNIFDAINKQREIRNYVWYQCNYVWYQLPFYEL